MAQSAAEVVLRHAASAADLAVLSGMLQACTAELREERGGELWSLTEGYAELSGLEQLLAARVDAEDQLTVLAAFDGIDAGCALAELRTLRDGRQLCHVTDIFVTEGFRSIGVGEVLIDHVLTWAQDRSAISVEVTALPGARETKNFFESHGFKARSLLLSKSLV